MSLGFFFVSGISEPHIEHPDEETEKYDDNVEDKQDSLIIEEEEEIGRANV